MLHKQTPVQHDKT